eukprot:4828036-Alexandrium_andersonii.AAC.1
MIKQQRAVSDVNVTRKVPTKAGLQTPVSTFIHCARGQHGQQNNTYLAVRSSHALSSQANVGTSWYIGRAPNSAQRRSCRPNTTAARHAER